MVDHRDGGGSVHGHGLRTMASIQDPSLAFPIVRISLAPHQQLFFWHILFSTFSSLYIN